MFHSDTIYIQQQSLASPISSVVPARMQPITAPPLGGKPDSVEGLVVIHSEVKHLGELPLDYPVGIS